MATSSNTDIASSKESARYLRLQLLIVNGGTYVSRSIFDTHHPPSTLLAFLAAKQADLGRLKARRVITQPQWGKLFPLNGTSASHEYDLALLKCLLRHFCLNEKAQAFQTGNPAPGDASIEADVVRVGNFRNELAHGVKASLSEQDFQAKWTEIEQVLCRLGKNIPDLQNIINDLKTTTIDPEMEAELQSKIEFLEEVQRATQSSLDDVNLKLSELQIKNEDLAEQVREGNIPIK